MKDYEDIPSILNSISWQLKRIADALERTRPRHEIQEEQEQQTVQRPKTFAQRRAE